MSGKKKRLTISVELYRFLMGSGPIDGTWFNEMNDNLPGRFWWRALLRAEATAQGIEAAQPTDGGE